MDMQDTVTQFPRTVMFSKIERIVQSMLNSVHGVPKKTQKYLLTTIPEAFTGEDLVQWLMARLRIAQHVEALHLATIICRYGYFFHVSTGGAVTVREDKDHYRFQSPYYWLSVNWHISPMEYAVYLTKRSILEKGIRGFSESETTDFDELRQRYHLQWDIILQSAEAQIKGLKDRKKIDKTVLASQERAFWKYIKSNQETSINQTDIKTTLVTERPCRADQLISRIQMIKAQISSALTWSSTHISLCSYAEQCEIYDPFITPVLPSNPWITDDSSYWEVNEPIIDCVTQDRIKRWSLSFPELLRDLTGVQHFMKFCEMEFTQESLRFYLAARDLRQGPFEGLQARITQIMNEHIVLTAPAEVNLVDHIRSELIDRQMGEPSFFIFTEAELHIYELLKKNSFERFISSDYYKNLMKNSTTPTSKRGGLFNFVRTQSNLVHTFDFEDSEIFVEDPDGCVPTIRV